MIGENMYQRLIEKYDVNVYMLPALEVESPESRDTENVFHSLGGNMYLKEDVRDAINKAIKADVKRLRSLADAREQDSLE